MSIRHPGAVRIQLAAPLMWQAAFDHLKYWESLHKAKGCYSSKTGMEMSLDVRMSKNRYGYIRIGRKYSPWDLLLMLLLFEWVWQGLDIENKYSMEVLLFKNYLLCLMLKLLSFVSQTDKLICQKHRKAAACIWSNNPSEEPMRSCSKDYFICMLFHPFGGSKFKTTKSKRQCIFPAPHLCCPKQAANAGFRAASGPPSRTNGLHSACWVINGEDLC